MMPADLWNKQYKFPHFSRFISASLFILEALAILAGGAILLVLNLRASHQPFPPSIYDALNRPWDPASHSSLARLTNAPELKKTATGFARALSTKHEAVLGAQAATSEGTSPKWVQSKASSLSYDYWRGVTGRIPEYRDAWIQLGIAAYQIGRPGEALVHFYRARLLSPNDPTITELVTQVSSGL